jgi:kynureninase
VNDAGGAFVVLEHPNAKALCTALDKRGVKADARGKYLRLCPDYLNSRAELESAAQILLSLLKETH